MTNVKIGNMEIPLGNLLLMIGGLIMLISVFLAWTVYSTPTLTGWKDYNISGLDIISGKVDGNSISYSFLGKAPLFIMILGILAIILAALPLFKVDMPAITIAAAVIALLGLIFAILYLTVGGGASLFTGDDKDGTEILIKSGVLKMKLAFGSYFSLIGALVATVGGVLNVIPMFKK